VKLWKRLTREYPDGTAPPIEWMIVGAILAAFLGAILIVLI
jgi:hypothetical protein